MNRKADTVEIPFPMQGLDVSTSQESQPARTTADCRNVRIYDQVLEMDRGGQRQGLARAVNTATSSFCQEINGFTVVVDDDS